MSFKWETMDPMMRGRMKLSMQVEIVKAAIVLMAIVLCCLKNPAKNGSIYRPSHGMCRYTSVA
jgi:hypothetical protein